jgi:hypothetical protein
MRQKSHAPAEPSTHPLNGYFNGLMFVACVMAVLAAP